MSFKDYFEGRKLLEERESKYNGTLSVYYEAGWGKVIYGGGLPQCGGLAKKIWELPLRTIKKREASVESVLILGFGGGGIAQIVDDLWPTAEITGVDIDKDMVELGEEYLGWPGSVDVVIDDAEDFVKDLIKQKRKFDVVCVDMYVQTEVPKKFRTKSFTQKVKKLLTKDGVAVFNRLYGDNDEGAAKKFKAEVLDKVYKEMDIVYPAANIMFLCKN